VKTKEEGGHCWRINNCKKKNEALRRGPTRGEGGERAETMRENLNIQAKGEGKGKKKGRDRPKLGKIRKNKFKNNRPFGGKGDIGGPTRSTTQAEA